jgi:hypothetical protein
MKFRTRNRFALSPEFLYSMSPESGRRLRDKDMRKNKELKRGERI